MKRRKMEYGTLIVLMCMLVCCLISGTPLAAQGSTKTENLTPGASVYVDLMNQGDTYTGLFTVTDGGTYSVYAYSYDQGVAIWGYIYDPNGNVVASNESNGDLKINVNLKDPGDYKLVVRLKEGLSKGTFQLEFNCKGKPVSCTASRKADTFLGGVPVKSYIAMDISGKDADGGYTGSTVVNSDHFTLNDMWNYRVWIKDSHGNYSYDDAEGDQVRYTDADRLDVGKYTIEVRDYTDDDIYVPDENGKIYLSYDINVKSAADYFDGKNEISDTEEREFATEKLQDVYSYYRFSPQTSGEYIFTGVKDNIQLAVYDENMASVDFTNNSYTLEAGKQYYVGLRGYTLDENGIIFFSTKMMAKKYQIPESGQFTLSKTSYLDIAKENPCDYLNAAITYGDGVTEQLNLKNSSYDSYGNKYFISMKKEGGDQEFQAGEELEKGTYTVFLKCELSGLGTVVLQTRLKYIKVLSFDQMELPELKEGENTVHSEDNGFGNNIYKFVMPYSGKIEIKPSEGQNTFDKTIYEMADGNAVKVTGTLTGQKTYYIVFNGGIYDFSKDDYIYVQKNKVSFVPLLESVSVVENTIPICVADEIARYKNPFIANMRVKLSYSDGSDKVSSLEDVQEISVGYSYWENDGRYLYEISVGDKKCTGSCQSKSLSDMTVGELKPGDNDIEIRGGEETYYTFVPDEDGVYTLNPCNKANVYYLTRSEGRYTVHEATSGADGDSYKVLMEAGVTYYVNVNSSLSFVSQNQTINLSLPESGVLRQPESWTASGKILERALTYILWIDANVDNVKKDCADTTVDIIYDDGSKDSIPLLPGEGDRACDRFYNTVECNVLMRIDLQSETYSKCTTNQLNGGHYKLQFIFKSASGETYENLTPIEIPFDVKHVSTAVDGEWDITQPLKISGNKNRYTYKIVCSDDIYSAHPQYRVVSDNKNVTINIYDVQSVYKYISRPYYGDDLYIDVYTGYENECTVTATNKTDDDKKEESQDWEIVKKPTCTKTGLRRKLNKDTGVYDEEEIPAEGHKFTNKWVTSTPAGMEADGLRSLVCDICGAENKDKTQKISRIKSVELSENQYEYDGKAKEPSVTVKDADGKVVYKTCYTVAYKDNIKAGTATVTVVFKGNYSGTVKKSFTIKAAQKPDQDSTQKPAQKPNQDSTQKPAQKPDQDSTQKPAQKPNQDSTQKPAKVTVSATAIKTIANVSGGVKLTWKKVSGARGYYVYRKTGNGKFVKIKTLRGVSYKDASAKKNGVRYTYKVRAYKTSGGKTYTSALSAEKTVIYVSAPKCKSVLNVKGRKLKVTYSKNSKATGYQLQYSTKSSFKGAKTVRVKGAKNVSKVVRGLAKGRKYYVRVRSYKVSGGKTYYSVWSGRKAVSIRK